MILREGEIEIDCAKALWADKFDCSQKYPRNKYGLAGVDFIIEVESHVFFVELKDMKSMGAKRHGNTGHYVGNNQEKDKLKEALRKKFRDTWIYWRAMEESHKRIFCISFIESDIGGYDFYSGMSKTLKKILPVSQHQPCVWKAGLFENAVILDLNKWNNQFPDLPMRRVSATASHCP